jgi:hypothetical protein
MVCLTVTHDQLESDTDMQRSRRLARAVGLKSLLERARARHLGRPLNPPKSDQEERRCRSGTILEAFYAAVVRHRRGPTIPGHESTFYGLFETTGMPRSTYRP